MPDVVTLTISGYPFVLVGQSRLTLTPEQEADE